MTQAAVAPLARAQHLAGGAATVAVVAAVLIAIASAANGVAPAVNVFAERDVSGLRELATILNATGVFWVLALPGFLLAGALLDLSKVLDEYGKGQFFTIRASAHVRKAGEGAIWALVFKIVASPTIYSWITNEGRGFEWRMEPFDLGLIAFAAFVMVLGRVLEAAARIKEENDEIV